MSLPHRREFLKEAGLGLAAGTACHLSTSALRAAGANGRLQVGRVVHFDLKTETIVNDQEAANMVHRTYRDHWTIGPSRKVCKASSRSRLATAGTMAALPAAHTAPDAKHNNVAGLGFTPPPAATRR